MQMLRTLSLIILLTLCSQAIGQSEVVLESLLAAREEIADFHYVAKGQITPMDGSSESIYEILKQGENLRCDWTLTPGGNTTRVLITPAGSYVRIGNSEVLKISEAMARKYICAFDIKASGIALYQERAKGYSISQLVRSLQGQKEMLRSRQIESGLIELEYGPLPQGEVQISRIDPSKDFAVLSTVESKRGENQEKLQEAEVEWSYCFDKWVPTRLEVKRSGIIDRSFSVDWKSINTPIAPEVFDPKEAFGSSRFFVTEVNGRMVAESIRAVETKVDSKSGFWNRSRLIAMMLVLVAVSLLLRRFRRAT